MRDVSERDDRVLGLTAYLCDRCKSETLLAIATAEPPLDTTASDTEPGSPERQAVYADRARRGRAIFHPGDRKPTPGGALISHSTRTNTHDPQRRGIRRKIWRQHSRGTVFQVRVSIAGRQVHVGYYRTLEAAIAARDQAEARAGKRAA